MKRFLKNLSILAVLTISSATIRAQVVTSEPTEYTDPNTEVKIIVNLAQLDQTKDYVQNLIADAQADSGIYMWTWKPYEWPVGSELANGSGDRPWQNSNELLRLTKESDLVYSFTMVPTTFYNVDAATVYELDIHFLVKPKSGGGYGDPDRKSDDLLLEINPPDVERTLVYAFPSAPQQDDFVKIVYDNYRDTLSTMQNIGVTDCYLFIEATLTDGTVLKPASIFQTVNTPSLQMNQAQTGIFEFDLVPSLFLNLEENQQINEFKAVAVRRSSTNPNGFERVTDDLIIDLTCW
jgi:hypothetical protein